MKYSFLFTSFLVFFVSCGDTDPYKVYQGETQGTTFSVKYKDFSHEYENEIDSILNLVDMEFSTYMEDSRISNLNRSDFKLLDEIIIPIGIAHSLITGCQACDFSQLIIVS